MISEMTIDHLIDQFKLQGMFKPCKFKVTPEQSRKFQELFFKAGGRWNNDSVAIDVTYPHLYVSGGKLTHCNDKNWFENNSQVYTEIKIKDTPFASLRELFAYLSVIGNSITDSYGVVIYFEENGMLTDDNIKYLYKDYTTPQDWRPYYR